MPGFARVPNDVIRATGLSGYAKLIYVLLLGHADAEGRCWPSIDTLAHESGFSRRMVQYLLNALEAAGLVRRRRTRYATHFLVYAEPRSAGGALLGGQKCTTCTSEIPEVHHMHFTSAPPALLAPDTLLEEDPLKKNREASLPCPAELAGFEDALRGAPGYTPTRAFYAKVLKYVAIDLEEAAVKMAGWLAAHPRRQASAAFILNWLRKDAAERANGAAAAAAPPRGTRSIGRQGRTDADVIIDAVRYGMGFDVPTDPALVAACAERGLTFTADGQPQWT